MVLCLNLCVFLFFSCPDSPPHPTVQGVQCLIHSCQLGLSHHTWSVWENSNQHRLFTGSPSQLFWQDLVLTESKGRCPYSKLTCLHLLRMCTGEPFSHTTTADVSISPWAKCNSQGPSRGKRMDSQAKALTFLSSSRSKGHYYFCDAHCRKIFGERSQPPPQPYLKLLLYQLGCMQV